MIKVLHDFILVSQPIADAPLASGLVLMAGPEATQRCRVLAIGPGTVDDAGTPINVEVQPGDTVFLPKEVVSNAPKMKHEGHTLLFIKQMQILCWERKEA